MSATKQYELVYIVAPEATEEQLAELHDAGRASWPLPGHHRAHRQLGPPPARLHDRQSQGRHLRPRGAHRRRRPGEGARSPAQGARHRHPPPGGPRRRGPAHCGARKALAPGEVGAAAAWRAACRPNRPRRADACEAAALADDRRRGGGVIPAWRNERVEERPPAKAANEGQRRPRGVVVAASAAAASASSGRRRSTTSTTRMSSC